MHMRTVCVHGVGLRAHAPLQHPMHVLSPCMSRKPAAPDAQQRGVLEAAVRTGARAPAACAALSDACPERFAERAQLCSRSRPMPCRPPGRQAAGRRTAVAHACMLSARCMVHALCAQHGHSMGTQCCLRSGAQTMHHLHQEPAIAARPGRGASWLRAGPGGLL